LFVNQKSGYCSLAYKFAEYSGILKDCFTVTANSKISAPHHSVFYRPDALPATQPTASKH